MKEKKLQTEILKLIGSHPDFRLFRNHVGNGYTGTLISGFENGIITLANARRGQFGLCVGSGDLIGLQKITITEDMVGQEIARFISIEVKSENGKLKPEQKIWHDFINSFGGASHIVSHIDEAIGILPE